MPVREGVVDFGLDSLALTQQECSGQRRDRGIEPVEEAGPRPRSNSTEQFPRPEAPSGRPAPEALRIGDRETKPDALDSFERTIVELAGIHGRWDQAQKPRRLDRLAGKDLAPVARDDRDGTPGGLVPLPAVAQLGQVEHEPGRDTGRGLIAEAESLARSNAERVAHDATDPDRTGGIREAKCEVVRGQVRIASVMPGATQRGDRCQNQSDTDQSPSSQEYSDRREGERHADPLLGPPGLEVSIEDDSRRHRCDHGHTRCDQETRRNSAVSAGGGLGARVHERRGGAP